MALSDAARHTLGFLGVEVAKETENSVTFVFGSKAQKVAVATSLMMVCRNRTIIDHTILTRDGETVVVSIAFKEEPHADRQ